MTIFLAYDTAQTYVNTHLFKLKTSIPAQLAILNEILPKAKKKLLDVKDINLRVSLNYFSPHFAHLHRSFCSFVNLATSTIKFQ